MAEVVIFTNDADSRDGQENGRIGFYVFASSTEGDDGYTLYDEVQFPLPPKRVRPASEVIRSGQRRGRSY